MKTLTLMMNEGFSSFLREKLNPGYLPKRNKAKAEKE